MKVTLLDTHTGKTHETGDDFDAYWWTDGNGSCDCNRALMMLGDDAMLDTASGICLGNKRFLIIAKDDKEITLRELNNNYPKELLEKHGILTT